MFDRVGQQIGNYRLVRLLGRGGFAEVYLAEHIYLNRLAAIKILQTQLGQNDLQIFLSEARTIANFNHPNIIHVLEFGVNQQDNTPFLVMDYASNGTLRQRHAAGSRLAYGEILAYVRQIAPALQYAHNQNVIHRDVKPENMLIGTQGEILLSDFGIAVTTQSSRYQNQQQDVAGTAAYMAPEQLQGRAVQASDQYALAIIVYEWLCGERPFNGSFTEVIGQQIHTPPPPLRNKVPTISEDIEYVLQTALEKDPQQRFAHLHAFTQALENALRHTQQAGGAPNTAFGTNKFAHPSPQQGPAVTNTSMQVPLITPPLHQLTQSSLRMPPPQSQYNPNPPFNAQNPQTNMPLPSPLPVQMRPNQSTPTGKRGKTLSIISILLVLLVGGGIFFHSFILSSFTAFSSPTTSHGHQSTSTGSLTTKNNTPSSPSSIPPPTTTPTATPTPPLGNVLYQANWSNGADNWDLTGQWAFVQSGEIGANGNGHNILLAPCQLKTADYAVEATITYIGDSPYAGTNYSDFGVVVREGTDGKGYMGGIQLGIPAIVLVSNGSTGYPSQLGSNTGYQLGPKSHVYRVEAKGDVVTLFIDSSQVAQLKDLTASNPGRVGLLATSKQIEVTSFKVLPLS